ncbi:MAG TPA: alpha-hydroxy acid oxidase [Rhizomicrobium sp.]|jgi:isopentenyl diphosphate isomerase/L-lactate dehydrogenase-like FMN-dependent dehydrogenase
MADIERSWLVNPSRRNALVRAAGLMAGSPIAAAMAQTDPRPLGEHHRVLSLAEMQTSFDFEPVFFGNVVRPVYDYTAHGDGSEFTLRRNRQAFDWVDIVPARAAVPASQVDLSSELLGVKMKFPIIVAPTAAMVPLHPDGEIGMFKAATAASNTLMILSINTSTPYAKVAPAVPGGTLWGQFYPLENLASTQHSMDTYQNAGAGGIIVTIDQQASYYERTQQDRNFGGRVASVGGRGAGTAAATGSARYRISGGRLWYTWQYIDDMRKMIKGSLVIKGILDPQDARLAIEHGADAIIVSNHGGRSMDYGPSSLEVLPEIVAAVNGRIPVVFDSGIRRGADIFKALALGANAVMLGRTTRWGLAAFGAAGAQRLIEMLQQELVQVAAACGCAALSDINKTTVKAHFV